MLRIVTAQMKSGGLLCDSASDTLLIFDCFTVLQHYGTSLLGTSSCYSCTIWEARDIPTLNVMIQRSACTLAAKHMLHSSVPVQCPSAQFSSFHRHSYSSCSLRGWPREQEGCGAVAYITLLCQSIVLFCFTSHAITVCAMLHVTARYWCKPAWGAGSSVVPRRWYCYRPATATLHMSPS